jgi:phosphoglycolate phosphatase
VSAWVLSGRVVTGAGQGAAFTRLEWAREQFVATLGIDPYPGTLNLRLDAASMPVWSDVRARSATSILPPPDTGGCIARCCPARVADRLPAAIVLPDVSGYAPDQLEILAAVSLRESLALRDGDRVTISGGSPRPVRAAVFDVDGTLVNSIEGMRLAADRAASLYGYQVSLEMVRRALNFGESLWEMVIPAEDRNDPELPGILRRETWRNWPTVLETSVSPFAGLETTLRRLRERGLHLAIYTGSRGESLASLERSGLLEWFDPVITASDVLRPKPHPDGLLRILEQLGLAPHDAAYIGDTRHDILAGQAAGMRTIGVLTGAADSALLSLAGADWLISDHRGLPELLVGPDS